MLKEVQISLLPEQVNDEVLIKNKLQKKLRLSTSNFFYKWKKEALMRDKKT